MNFKAKHNKKIIKMKPKKSKIGLRWFFGRFTKPWLLWLFWCDPEILSLSDKSDWSLKWLMNLFLNLPLLKSVDGIWVCISTVVDLGNSENDVSSVIGYFNLMVFEIFDKNHILAVFYTQSQRISFSGKMIQWWNMNKSSIDETHHESVNAVDSFENKAFVKSIILTQYIYDSVNACIKAYFIHDDEVH